MPINPILAALPSAHDLIKGNLSVNGAMFLECFCGQAAITLACIMINVPCICPWDCMFGSQFNVLKFGHVIEQLILAQRIVAQHFAIPCQSLTWARLPQLRDAFHPEGLRFHTGNSLWSRQAMNLSPSQLVAVSCCIQWAASFPLKIRSCRGCGCYLVCSC